MVDFKHTLVLAGPFYGHNYPLLVLLSKLASRGCCERISFLVHSQASPPVRKLKHDLEASKELPEGVVQMYEIPVELPSNVPLPAKSSEDLRVLDAIWPATQVAVERILEEISAGSEPTCVVADLENPVDLSAKLPIPKVTFCACCGLGQFALFAHIPKLIESGSYNPLQGYDDYDKTFVHVPGYVPLRASDVPKMAENHPDPVYWEYNFERIAAIPRSQLILVNSFYNLEKEAYEHLLSRGLPIKMVGPLLPSESKLRDEEGCMLWLEKQAPRSVLYASFGTLLNLTSSQLTEIFLGFEASGEIFLISYRSDMVSDILGGELKSFLHRYSSGESDRGKIVSWSPQLQVLSHPSVGGFFAQYGTNATFEAILGGVPMIGKPVLGDTLMMRRLAISQYKIALEIEGDCGNRALVAKAVTQLMRNSSEQRNNVSRLRSSLIKAISPGGSSYQCLDELASRSKELSKQEVI